MQAHTFRVELMDVLRVYVLLNHFTKSIQKVNKTRVILTSCGPTFRLGKWSAVGKYM